METVNINTLEPLPGYRLIEPLGKGGFGEVWKCEAPGGLFKAIKFVRGVHTLVGSSDGVEQEMRALHHIKGIRHPFLLSLERVEIIDGDLVIVMELADRSLHDLLQQYRNAGCPGVPRDELLAYLGEAAEVLDLMNLQHGLQHLDIKPRNLFLVSGHAKVADFGLVNSLTDPDGQDRRRPCEAITPLYAAPEVFLGRLNLCCDQYSLAITYQELLTGTLPFSGGTLRQLAMHHMYDEPGLHALPPEDRPVVARALAKEPMHRYSCCSDFIQALLEVSPPASSARVRRPSGLVPRIDLPTPGKAGSAERPIRPSALHARMSAPPPPPAESPVTPSTPPSVLPGYQLVERLRSTDTAEAWRGQTADGRNCLIRLLTRFDPEQIRQEGGPLARLRALRHPGLLPVEVLVREPRQVALISDWPEQTLLERMRQSQQSGSIGIGRPELLRHLDQAAATLDELHEREGLQHLGLTPRHIVLHRGELLVQDYGLGELVRAFAGEGGAALSLRYAAPELIQEKRSRHCDQYSLAAIYYELLTGLPLFRNLSQRHVTAAKMQGLPDVSMISSGDRSIVLRALSINPEQRYGSCRSFIKALQAAAGEGKRSSVFVPRVKLPPTPGSPEPGEEADGTTSAGLQAAADEGSGERPIPPLPTAHAVKRAIAQQIAAAAGPWRIGRNGALHYRFTIEQDDADRAKKKKTPPTKVILEHEAFGCLMPATVSLKLKGFQEEWRLQLLEGRGPWAGGGEHPQAQGSTIFHYALPLPASFWQRWSGRQPEVRVAVTLTPLRRGESGLTHVQIHIQSRDCEPQISKELLESFGPSMLRSLHTSLQLSPERRREERLPLAQILRVFPLVSAHEVGDPISAEARDISPGGMGLYLPCSPHTEALLLEMVLEDNEKIYLPAQVCRIEPLSPKRYEVGIQFLTELPASLNG